jgi:hypothetical protein
MTKKIKGPGNEQLLEKVILDSQLKSSLPMKQK